MTNEPYRQSLTVFAPAKINLYLHVTGRTDDGYHNLDSLIGFADIGDEVRLTPLSGFSFSIEGPYANAFTARDKDASPDSGNLVVRAAWELARQVRRDLDCHVTLVKNLPLASGIGGGSSDAAAMLWALMEWWGIEPYAAAHYLPYLAASLGADVPVCMACKPSLLAGVSEVAPVDIDLPEVPILLVNPNKQSATPEIFRNYDSGFRVPASLPDDLSGRAALLDFLRAQDNDLTAAATAQVFEIGAVLKILGGQEGCSLARMSGSGATCFGLFDTAEQVLDAAERIAMAHPDWWVSGGTLNSPQRY